MSANTTSTGWILAASPMIFGLRKFASSRWMPMIQASTNSPCRRSKVPEEMRAIATIGTDERIEPKIGTRLIVAAIPARSSRYFTWKIQRPR